MKPPKNFYSNLDRRKQGLDGIPDIPVPSAEDVGKVIKVDSDGDYELGADASLPDVTESDNGKIVQVVSGSWGLRTLSALGIVYADSGSLISTTYNTGIRVISSATTPSFYMFGASVGFSSIIARIQNNGMVISIDDNGTVYKGIITKTDSSTIYSLVSSDGVNFREALVTASSITYTPIGSIKYYEIESSGSSVSLPSGVTFADVYSELQAGVDVKFTSGARVYSVTSFESTNIRAHWMTDLDLTSMEVYVINLASDGTGTVASATFSGS